MMPYIYFVLTAIIGAILSVLPNTTYARDRPWYVVVPVETCGVTTTTNGFGQVLGSYPSCTTQLACYLNDDVGERIKCPIGYQNRYKTQEKEHVNAILAKLKSDLKTLEEDTNAKLAVIDKRMNDNRNGEKRNYYPNGQLKNHYTLKDGKYEGLWKSWWENGQLQSIIPHIDGQSHGLAKEYGRDGKLLSEIDNHWDNINKTHQAVERHYHPNGKLKKEQTRINNNIQGVVKEYYDNGKLQSTTPYVNNQKHGIQQLYDRTGKTTQSIHWINNKQQF